MFYTYADKAHEIMTSKDYKELMLNTQGTAIIKGSVYEIKSKSVGAGLYDVTVKKRVYKK
jgi:hypothetical protein